MKKSTPLLTSLLDALARRARVRGWSDAQWAERAGVRKETLSRLRHRESCDLATLQGLAGAVGARLGILAGAETDAVAGVYFPASVDRAYEERLLELCAAGVLDPQQWAMLGPRFFMAGLAVMLASAPGHDRRTLLGLAEQLHPGASEPEVFARWLEKTPLKPSRFLPMLEAQRRHAA